MRGKRPDEVRALYDGAKRMAPGLYETKDGCLLVNACEILLAVGLDDKAEDRELVAQVVKEYCEQNGIVDVREL